MQILPIIVIVNFLEQRNLVPTSFKEAKKRKPVEVERLPRKASYRAYALIVTAPWLETSPYSIITCNVQKNGEKEECM